MQRITESLAREILPLVQAMKHEDFERMIVDHLDRRREDFVNVKKGPRGRDGGSDITALLVAPDNQPRKVSVQCKRYKSTSLSSEDVSDTFQGITNTASDLGILASSQELSQSARDYIQGLGRRWGAEIRWEEWCGTGLMKTLLRFPSVLLEYFPGIRSRLPLKHEWEPACPGFEIVTGQEPPSGSPERFYNGFPPAWSDLAGNHDIGRRSYDSVLRIVKNISAPSPGKVPGGVITGSAGAGKTTLLRRAGFDAARSGMLTIILKNDWRTYSSGLALQVGELARISKSRVLVLVDDVADLGARRLEGMLRELAEEGVPACFLFAEESGPWNFVLKYVPSVRDMRPSHVRLTELLDSERDELVDRILQYEHDGLIQSHCRLTRSERLVLFEAAEHQMVVALFKLRHGANFRTIIEREYDRIPDALTQSLYATVCYLCGRFGFAIPENLALKQTGINQPAQIDLFVAVTKDLLVEEAGLLRPRHSLIGQIVAQHSVGGPRAKEAALTGVVAAVTPGNAAEEAVLNALVTGDNHHRRIVEDLHRNPLAVDRLYEAWLNTDAARIHYNRKRILSSYGLATRALGDIDAAREHFRAAIALDPSYAFALRQWAWLETQQAQWESAARLARTAADASPDDFVTQLQCAQILMYNGLEHYGSVRQYFERAKALSPSNPDVIRLSERYEMTIASFIQAEAEGTLTPGALRNLRPGRAIVRAWFGSDSRDYRDKLKSDLRNIEEDEHIDAETVHELEEEIPKDDRLLRSLIDCILARSLYWQWYHEHVPHDHDNMEALFKRSLAANAHDPFAHCWYGTFLKEARRDFDGARRHYNEALEMERHPLFLNNLALLLIDEYRRSKNSSSLADAKKLLTEAVRLAEEGTRRGRPNFSWPADSLAKCQQLIEDQKRTYGKGADASR